MAAGTTRWSLVGLVLIGLGSAASGYLLVRSWDLMAGGAMGRLDVCSTVFGRGCDATLQSASSWQLGIPLAGWGIVYYCTLAALLALSWWLGAAFRAEALLAALLLAALGAGISLLLAGLVLVGWAPHCPLCLIVQLANLALVPALKKASGLTVRELRELAGGGCRYLLGRTAAAESSAPWKVVGFFAAALVGVVAYQWVFVETALRRSAASAGVTPEQALREYQSAARQDLVIDATDPRLGPPDAPVQLVVFISFQCPACADLARSLRPLPEEFGPRLCLAVKHFPLSSACNPALRVDKQPRACEAARAAVAAQAQGQFWPMHDALLKADLSAEDALPRIAREAGLDLARFKADLAVPATAAKVQSDVELARRLGVAETPAVFLNGRRVQHFSPEVLRFLIVHELAAQRPEH